MYTSKQLLNLTPVKFIKFLKKENIRKFYFVYDDKKQKLICSHKTLQPIADYFSKDKRDFLNHEGIFFELDSNYDTLFGAFVHKTKRGQGAGGLRYWDYDSFEEFFRDGLRLSAGMTRKNALAGLWWGGGKGVVCHNPANNKNYSDYRDLLFKNYGRFITSLKGCYVTAEDVGTTQRDMESIFDYTRYITCIPPEKGGSGNPSGPTAMGVVTGMEAALYFLNKSTLEGKTVAVQGLGNVASRMINILYEKGVSKVIACDINPELVKQINEQFPHTFIEAYTVSKYDVSIFSKECDIFSPCATGGILNSKTIPKLKAKIVCGGANNQLEDPVRDDKSLIKRKIIYVPDFLTNRMGIVNCANEQYGYVNNDPAIEMHFNRKWKHSIFNTTIDVLKESKKKNKPTGEIAIKLADKYSELKHPIFGHRGRQIIKSLAENEWHNL